LFLASVSVIAAGMVDASAADLPLGASPPYSWTGLYLGPHLGGAVGLTKFSDPFGASIFGDTVHSPGFSGGGQIGYNWQLPGTAWVLGLEGDLSGLDSDGTTTCFAASLGAVNSTCRVRPKAEGTLTGRLGFAVGPDGHTLIYGKGGLAWASDKLDMALNEGFSTGSSQTLNLWGGTIGVGIEQALTPAWSVKLEYDYLTFAKGNVANNDVANVFNITQQGNALLGSLQTGTSSVSQNIHELKVGLNYRFGLDPWAQWNSIQAYAVKSSPVAVSAWEFEGGGRYVGSWGRFQKDIGVFTNSGVSNISNVSRITYDDMPTNAGELFGRIDSPWNLFVKGFGGGGWINGGHMNDEDFLFDLTHPYSNTLASSVKGDTAYGAIDGGFNVLRGSGYKVGLFGGYFLFNENMKAFGCTPVASDNCIVPVSTSGAADITEKDQWRAARVGVAAETMITDRLKIGGEVAYLPWVSFNGVDHHFFGNSGILAEEFPESGSGRGVQIDALVSYYLTPQWSIGVGGRYWGLWTSSGQFNADLLAGVPVPPTPPQVFKAQVEQAGAFVQTSYKFSIP
jgi:opacity protein-like surface antigen